MTDTVYQILTGVLPPSKGDQEEGTSAGGQGLAGGVADMAVLQNLAHRPKDQVEESLALICELLPPLPKDGVFDTKSYSEKSLARIRKGRKSERPDRPSRHTSRNGQAGDSLADGTGTSTPIVSVGALLPTSDQPSGPSYSVRDALAKAKRDADQQMEQRVSLLKSRPELLGKFVKAIVPVLVDVYAATVAPRVRAKVLNGLVKAIAAAEQDHLKLTLEASTLFHVWKLSYVP